MFYINNADTSYSSQRVTLGGSLYTLTFKFNSRNKSWYLTINEDNNDVPIIKGIKIVPNQNLTYRYLIEGIEGDLWCLRLKNELTPLGLDNLGKGKTYRLVWATPEESLQLQEIINNA